MARVYIPSQTWSPVIYPDAGNYRPKNGASVQIKNLDGSNATHYSAITAGSSATTALTANSDGTLPGRWIEENEYDIVIDGGPPIRVPASGGSALKVLKEAPINVSLPEYGGLTGERSQDATAGLQTALTAAVGTGNPDTTARFAKGAIYLPGGEYRLTQEWLIKSVFGLHVFGDGPSATNFIIDGTFTNGLHLDGVAHCVFEKFGIMGDTTSTADAVDNAINTHWTGVVGQAATRRTRYRDITIRDLRFKNGMAFELVDSAKQNDEITLDGCVIAGGNSDPKAPDATWWQTGVRIGSTGASSGNTFQYLLLNPGIQTCRSGVEAIATSVHSIGGGFQANTFDFNVHNPWGSGLVVESLRTEQATRLLTDEAGSSGASVGATLRHIQYAGQNLHADGYLVIFRHAGNLTLEDVHVLSSAIDPKVFADSGALGKTITTIRRCRIRTPPQSIGALADDATRTLVVDDYVQTDAGGVGATATFPGRYVEAWHEVGTAGNPAFAGSWKNFGGAFETAAFYKDPGGLVHLKGLVDVGSGTIFTLPAGYRPAKTEVFTVVSTGGAFGEIRLASTGTLQLTVGTGSGYVSLSGISFRAA